MNIALIAHDRKKDDIIKFIKENKQFFSNNNLIATGTTGHLIKVKLGLEVDCVKSGPLGGDQQIGGKITNGEIDLVIFLRDPLTAQPHEPDITALLRICDVYYIPVATNLGTANAFIKHFHN